MPSLTLFDPVLSFWDTFKGYNIRSVTSCDPEEYFMFREKTNGKWAQWQTVNSFVASKDCGKSGVLYDNREFQFDFFTFECASVYVEYEVYESPKNKPKDRL